jgi:hypothetical protein
MIQSAFTATDPVATTRQVVAALGDVFDDEGPYLPDITAQALNALGTCTSYLAGCLGPGRRAAIPDTADLAAVLLALHIASTQLYRGLQPALHDIDRRAWPADQAGLAITRIAAVRAALDAAAEALRVAAVRFAEAHHAAAGQPDRPRT